MLDTLKIAVRSFRAAPDLTAVALVILTLGVGASTAIYSVVDAIVLRGLPFEDADRLIDVRERTLFGTRVGSSVAPQNFLDWRARQSGLFEDLAAVAGGVVTFRDREQPEAFQVARVSASLFPLLRVQPRLGRSFTAPTRSAATIG